MTRLATSRSREGLVSDLQPQWTSGSRRPWSATLRGLVALVTAVVLAASCTTWRRQTGPPGVTVTQEHPDRVRLVLVNKEQVTLYGPAIDGDRLVAWTRPEKHGNRDASYPLAEIQSLETSVISSGRTAALVAGIGVTAVLVIAAIGAASDEPAPPTTIRWSCPLIYSATDSGWRLDSGTFGGAIMRPLRRTDVDNLDFARPRGGVLTLKLANELDETDFVDAVEVLAVDHPPATTVGPSPDGTLHALGPLAPPMQARDFSGRNVLSSVSNVDGRSWESELRARPPGSMATRDGIELSFRRSSGTTSARLVVDARNTPWSSYLLGEFVAAHGNRTADWYAALEAEPARAAEMQAFLAREAFLRVSIETERGWVDRGLVWEVGPEIVKRQVIPIDLSEVAGDMVRVRLDAPASFWLVDYVGLDASVEPPVSVRALGLQHPASGAQRERLDTLAVADGREQRLEPGEWMELHFEVPPIAAGRARSYMARTTGWYRIHASETNEPDQALLASVMKPGGVADVAAARLNTALDRLRLETQPK